MGTLLQCQPPSDSESTCFMVDALSIFRHHVHGGVWTHKMVLGGESVSKLPNYGLGIPHVDIHEHWVSACARDCTTFRAHTQLGRDGISLCTTSKIAHESVISTTLTVTCAVPSHTRAARKSLMVSIKRIVVALLGHSRCSSHGTCLAW